MPIDLETAINTEIDTALKAGKITPATVDYHKAQCRTEGGLERFKQFVAATPVIGGDTNLDGKNPDGGNKALNAEEKDVIAKMESARRVQEIQPLRTKKEERNYGGIDSGKRHDCPRRRSHQPACSGGKEDIRRVSGGERRQWICNAGSDGDDAPGNGPGEGNSR
jgi:hypothetical protein